LARGNADRQVNQYNNNNSKQLQSTIKTLSHFTTLFSPTKINPVMADEDNFFAVAPEDGAPPAEGGDSAPAAESDFFGAPPAVGGADSGNAFIGDVNEATGDENAFAGVPMDDAFAAPPAEDDGGAILLGGPPPETEGVDDAGVEAEAPAPPAEPTGPSPMSIWNDEWQETLKQRKQEEDDKKAEQLEDARVAIENFQKERESKREAKMAKNREEEQAKLEAIEADLENDNSWQRVCKMVELSHDSTDAAEDVKRMRDTLIYLKNDKARAEVLGS